MQVEGLEEEEPWFATTGVSKKEDVEEKDIGADARATMDLKQRAASRELGAAERFVWMDE